VQVDTALPTTRAYNRTPMRIDLLRILPNLARRTERKKVLPPRRQMVAGGLASNTCVNCLEPKGQRARSIAAVQSRENSVATCYAR
jgi:hypothetical protein